MEPGNLFATLKAARYRQTFMLYSSTQGGAYPNNAYAAAAAMGSLAGRENVAGGYFDLMSKPIAGVQPEPLIQSPATTIGASADRTSIGLKGNSSPSFQPGARANLMIKVDFRNDWKEFLEKDMVAYGLEYAPSKSAEENTIRYLNAKRRIARSTGRTIHESKELCIPIEYVADYSSLRRLLTEGGDLKPYLSRDIRKKRADKNDGILNAWGIQHLHFRPEGTGHVLFVKITDADIFVIQAAPHGN